MLVYLRKYFLKMIEVIFGDGKFNDNCQHLRPGKK